MPTQAELEYLRRQSARQKANTAQGTQIITQGQSGEDGDTSWSSLSEERGLGSQPNWFEQAVGKVDETFSRFGRGFLGFFEGLADAGATAIGALGDATGWFESKPFTDWAQVNVADNYMQWAKTFRPGFVQTAKNISDGTYLNGDYWNQLWNGLGKVFTDDGSEIAKGHDAYYDFHDQYDTQAGEFIGGISESIGRMVPTIALGMDLNAAGLGQTATEAATLAPMAVSAGGSASAEALSEGANSGQALLYGALSGGAEALSEIVVGKALKFVGLGTGKIAGVISDGVASKTAKLGTKALIWELVKTMNEEGVEEVSTALLEPLFKAVYKGTDSLVDGNGTPYIANPSFWFGENGHFNEGVVGQYLAGALSGGVMGGVNTATVVRKVGVRGYDVIKAFETLAESDIDMAKEVSKKGLEYGSDEYVEASQGRGQAANDFVKALDSFLEKADQSQKENLARYLSDAGALERDLESARNEEREQAAIVDDFIQGLKKDASSHERMSFRNFVNRVQSRFGTDFTVEFDKGIDGNAVIDRETKTITMNPSILETEGGAVFAHEYIQHAIGHALRPIEAEMFERISESVEESWKKDIEDRIAEDLEQVEREGASKGWDAETVEKAKQSVREDEYVAYFLEDSFAGKNLDSQIKAIEKAFKKQSLIRRFLNLVNGVRTFDVKALADDYVRKVAGFVAKLQTAYPTNPVMLALAKEANGLPLTDAERRIKENLSEVFSAVSSKEGRAVAFSRKGKEKPVKTGDRGFLTKENGERAIYKVSSGILVPTGVEARSHVEDYNPLGQSTVADKRVEGTKVKEGMVGYAIARKPYYGDMDYMDDQMIEDLFDKGFDAIVNIDDGMVVLSDLERRFVGKEEQNEKEGSERGRHLGDENRERGVNQLSDEEFGNLIGRDSFGKTIRDQKEYVKEIERRRLYKRKPNVLEDGESKYIESYHHIIPEKWYTKRMAAVSDLAKKNGADVIYYSKTPSLLGEGDACGLYAADVCHVDASKASLTTDYGNAEIFAADQIARHELGHHLIKTTGIIDDIFWMFESEIAEGGEVGWQLSRMFEDYKKRWGNYYKHFKESKADMKVYEEMAVQLWSESRLLTGEARAWQNRFIKYLNREFGVEKADFNRFRYSRKKTKGYNQTDEFRNLQKESRSQFETKGWRERVQSLDESLRGRLSSVFGRELVNRGYGNGDDNGVLTLTSKGNEFRVFEKVDGQTFHDIFEIARTYLDNGELVDLHGVETTDDGIGYNDTRNYLSDDGLSGFSITPQGDLISVFNLGSKRGWLRAIAPIIKENAKTLDCYVSSKQNLQEMYSRVFGFQTASIMDFNEEYDHDDIGANHGNPSVAFMVNVDSDVETRHFGKDDWEGAHDYQQSVVAEEAKKQVVDSPEIKPEKPKAEIPAEYVRAVADVNNDKVYAFSEAISTIRKISGDLFKAMGLDSKLYRITYDEGNVYDNARKLFELFNKKGVSAAEIVDGLYEMFSSIRFVPKSEKGNAIVPTADFVSFADRTDVADIVKKRISDFTMSGKDSLKTKVAKREAAFREAYTAMKKTLSAYARDMRARIDASHTLRTVIKNMPEGFDNEIDLNAEGQRLDLYRKTQMGSLLAAPFLNITYKREGRFGTLLKNYQTLSSELDKVLSSYSEEWYDDNATDTMLPFDPELRRMVSDFRKSLDFLPEPKARADGVILYPNLTTEQIKEAANILKAVAKLQKRTSKVYSETLNPRIRGARKALEAQTGRKFTRAVALNPYVFNAASFYAVVNARLGNSEFAREITIGMELADGERKRYIASVRDLIKERFESLGIRDADLSERVVYNGVDTQMDVLLDLYCSLKSNNFDDFDKNGVVIKDRKGVSHRIMEKGTANDTLAELGETLPKKIRDYGDWLVSTLYNEKFLKDYVDYRTERGYRFAPVSGNYYPRFASINRPTDATKLVKSPRLFTHDNERVAHNNPFLLRSATSRAMEYANEMGTALYVYPKYRENFYVLSQIWEDLGKTGADLKFRDALQTTLGMWVGLKVGGRGRSAKLMSFLSGNYTKKLLSFNVGTPLRQTISLLYSNLGLKGSLQGVWNRLFGSKEFKAEFNYLANEFADMAFRARGSENLKVDMSTGAGKIAYYLGKVTDAGMKGIEIFDIGTVKAGLSGCMAVVRDMGYRIGTAEFRSMTEELFANFVETQIGSNPSNLSRLARGDSPLEDVGRFISFMQGPMRAALAAFVDKFTTAGIARGWTREKIDSDLARTADAVARAQEEYDALAKEQATLEAAYKEMRMSKGDEVASEDELTDAKAKVEDAKARKEAALDVLQEAKSEYGQARQNERTFVKYKAQGGKAWFVSSVASMAVGSMLSAIIEALVRHLKGKEDWDEWDGKKIFEDAIMYGTTGWLPLVNVVTNAIKGYDTSYPTGAILQEFGDIVSAVSNAIQKGFDEKTSKALFREMVSALSIGTGLAVKNIYDLVHGAVNAVSPSLGESMNGVFYVDYQTTAKIIEAVQSGKDELASSRVAKLMSEYVGETSESLRREILELVKEGENPLPSAVPTEYSDSDGDKQTLTWTQRQNAKRFYSRANSQVSRLIATNAYKRMTAAQRASTIKTIYRAFRTASVAKAVGKSYDGALDRYALLAKTGDPKVATLIAAVTHIRSLKETDKKSKKEQALEYVNGLALTKGERLMVLKLAGYGVDSDSLKVALRQKGMPAEDIAKFL